MEKRNILLGQDNDDEESEGENTQSIITIGDRFQKENNNAINHVIETENINKKREIVLSLKSNVKNINVSNLAFERMLKSCNRFISIGKLNRAKILKEKYDTNIYKISNDRYLFQYSGDQLPDIRFINVDLNYSYCSLLVRNLLSEKLNSSCNSKMVCNFVRNTFPEFNHPKKMRNFVVALSQENTSIKTEGIMEELFRMYKKYQNISSGKRTSANQENYYNYETDVKMFLIFLFENLFNVEIKLNADRRISHEKKKLSNHSYFANSNHVVAESTKIIDPKYESDSTDLKNFYNTEKDVPQEQEFMKPSTTNFKAEISLLVNKKPSIDDHILPGFINHWLSEPIHHNHKNICLEDFTKVSNFEPQLPLEENKKSSMGNLISPYSVYSCYSQANYQNTDDMCLQDYLKKSFHNFEFQEPLLINKKSLIDDEVLPDFANHYYNKQKHQNQEGICLQSDTEENVSNFESQSSLLINKNTTINDKILPFFAYPYSKCNASCRQDFTEKPVGNSESRTPLLVNKKDLIDNHIPPGLVHPCYSQRESINSEDMCPQDFTKESTGNFELKIHLLVDAQNLTGDHIMFRKKTNTFSSNIKLLYYSKHYYKVYCKYLIDRNFYKLRKEARAKISKTKINWDKQCCNQIQNNTEQQLNYNVVSKKDKIYSRICLKGNVSDNNLRQFGFCNETSNNSNTSASPKISENSNSFISKVKSPTEISDIFQLNTDSFGMPNKSVKKLPKIAEKILQPTFKEDEKHTDDIMSITDSATGIYYSCSAENFALKKEVCTLRIAPSYNNSCKKLNEKAFNSPTAVVKRNTEGKRKLFGDVKIDNVKRVFHILGPTFKPDPVRRLNSINNPNEQTCEVPLNRLVKISSVKRKLFSGPKIDNVKRVRHILDPRCKYEPTSNSLNVYDMQSEA